MSQYLGFDADVSSINDIANKQLPEIADAIRSRATATTGLNLANTGAVFSNATAPSQLGSKYDALVEQLADNLTAIGGSIDTAAQRLKKIADNYQRIDQSLSGQ